MAFRQRLGDLLPTEESSRSELLCRELEEASLALGARLARRRRRRAAGMLVKVLCYEGLGMTTWLAALVAEVLPPGARIDTEWNRTVTIEEGEWDLIVSTYDIDAGATPVLVVDADAHPEEIRRQVREVVQDIAGSSENLRKEAGALTQQSSEGRGLSLQTIMTVVRTFFVIDPESDAELLSAAIEGLNTGDCDVDRLRQDFERRESYGSLVFEETGTRLLHCRSSGIPEPRAGLVRPRGAYPVLVLAAPRSSPPEQTGVLSELVVALTDEPGFAALLGTGDRESIQGGLISLFSHRLG